MAEVVAWAAGNGDRSEKRRLPVRQAAAAADRWADSLSCKKRIEAAEVVDPEAPRSRQAEARAFFGATVRYANAAGAELEW